MIAVPPTGSRVSTLFAGRLSWVTDFGCCTSSGNG